MKKSIIVVTLALCVVAGAGIASASPILSPRSDAFGTSIWGGAKPYPDLPNAPVYTSRYPVIGDIAALEARVDVLERDLAQTRSDLHIARDQIGALQLLRAYDIGFNQRTRAEDQRRIVALEWAVAGQRWSRCGLGDMDK